MTLKPITKPRLSEAAVEQIKKFIVSHKMVTGSKLPSERELVILLAISRASVREALQILEIMGLVEAKPGKGNYVKALTADLFAPLSTWLSTHKETLKDHFEARLILEPAAAALAALRAGPGDISKMQETLGVFKENLESQDLVGLIKADTAFHGLIGAATGNKTIKLFMDTITRFLFEGWKASLRIEGRPYKTVQEHTRILKAIMAKDQKKARQAMERHLREAVVHLKDVWA